MNYKRVVIKVGTNVLTQEQGLLDLTNISHLVDQIVALKQQGVQVILVSSGAVGAGKSIFSIPSDLNKIVRRQVLSSIGQIRLMEIYRQFFSNYQLFCGQLLVTKEDFRDRQHYINMKNCFHALLRDEIVPIVNENDVVSINELMFTDNDELAGLVAAMTNAEALIILSNVDGVMDGAPDLAQSKVISIIDANDKSALELILPNKSSFGRGGMRTKFRIAQKAAKVGISTIIANGKRPNILVDIVNGDFVGTTFPAKGVVSNMKKWLAYNESESKGLVVINQGAVEALRSPDRITSLLPVGVLRIDGLFKKGDLIQIQDENGLAIAFGIAQYGAEKAEKFLGKKNKKELVHYDYLFVEEE